MPWRGSELTMAAAGDDRPLGGRGPASWLWWGQGVARTPRPAGRVRTHGQIWHAVPCTATTYNALSPLSACQCVHHAWTRHCLPCTGQSRLAPCTHARMNLACRSLAGHIYPPPSLSTGKSTRPSLHGAVKMLHGQCPCVQPPSGAAGACRLWPTSGEVREDGVDQGPTWPTCA